jgi:hypothetical protein
LSTAKLVVTFSAAIAAGFASAAMQANNEGGWAHTAAILMLFTIWVVVKRKSEPDAKDVEKQPPDVVQAALKKAASADKDVAQSAHTLMVWQVVLSLGTSLSATIDLWGS